MKRILLLIPAALIISCGSETSTGNEGNDDLDTTSTEQLEEVVEETFDIPHFGGDDAACFGAIHERFASWLGTDSMWTIFPGQDKIYAYLITHSDSLGQKTILEIDEEWGGAKEWQQTFSNGMTFKQKNMDGGSDYHLWTSCKDMDIIQKNIFPLIQDVENDWNEDHTKYEPAEIGCGYDFGFAEDSTVTITWYCGC